MNGTDFGDTFLKLSSTGGLTIADYFTPFNQEYLNQADIDLGSSGAVLLPDAAGSSVHRHLLVSAGKEGRIYLLDRDQMGHFNAAGDGQIVQSLEGAIGPLYGGPAYFNNTLYFSASNDVLKAFSICRRSIESVSHVPIRAGLRLPRRNPHVSANGSSNGIVWLLEGDYGGTLHAYDASNVAHELYNSQMKISPRLAGFVREVHHSHRCQRQGLCRHRKLAGRLRAAQPTSPAFALRSGECSIVSARSRGAGFAHFHLRHQPRAGHRVFPAGRLSTHSRRRDPIDQRHPNASSIRQRQPDQRASTV